MRYFILFLILILTSCSTRSPYQPYPNNNPANSQKTMEELVSERDQAKQDLALLDQVIKDREISNAKKIGNLVGSICLLLGAGLVITSFFLIAYPLLTPIFRIAGSIILALGACAFAYAVIYPYLILIGCSIVALIIGLSLYFWFCDRSTLKKVIKSVDELKPKLQKTNYREVFSNILGTSGSKWVEKIRKGTNKVTDKRLNSNK